MDEEETLDFQEIEFHDFIRKHVVCLLIFITLYGISFQVIRYFKTRTDNDELYAGDEDFFVYRISVWMCSFSLTISLGAVTLLPFSVFGSEVLLSYPDNFYLKWLNMSLINSLWNYVFLLSNVSLFFFLPFAYFFLESQGLSFHQRPKPFVARVYETICVCVLLFIMLICLANVFYSLFLSERLSLVFSLISFSNLSVPLVYSIVSLAGVVLLLISAPLGFAKMFDFGTGLIEDHTKEETKDSDDEENSESNTPKDSNDRIPPFLRKRFATMKGNSGAGDAPVLFNVANEEPKPEPQKGMVKRTIEALRYPVVMLIVFALTVLSVSMVLVNTFKLTFGFRELNEYVQYVEVRSRHRFGIAGALVENTIILYVMVSSLLGVYSMPLLNRLRPKRKKTSMTVVIINCAVILILSSALPVLANTLGITSFDLLGGYGHLNWISNFSLVWFYNIFFAVASTICLLNKFTSPVRVELWKRISFIRSHPTGFRPEHDTKSD